MSRKRSDSSTIWLPSLLAGPLSGRFGKFSLRKATPASSRAYLKEIGNVSRALGVSYGRLDRVRKEFSRNIDSGWDASMLTSSSAAKDMVSDLKHIQTALSSNDVLQDGVVMCGGALFASIPCAWLGHKVFPFLHLSHIEREKEVVSSTTPSCCKGRISDVGRLVIDLKSVSNKGLLPSLRVDMHLWIRTEVSFNDAGALLFRVRTSPSKEESAEMALLVSRVVEAIAAKISKVIRVRAVHRRTLERHSVEVAAADRLEQLKRLSETIDTTGHSKNKLRRASSSVSSSSSRSGATRYRPSESTQERRSPKPRGGGGGGG